MDGFIFIIFIIFFVLPFMRRITKNANKSVSKYKKYPKPVKTWGMDHGQVKQKRHRDLHRNDSSNVFPEDHDDRVQLRDARDRKEFQRMEATIHSKNNRAMTKVSNKGRHDWGARGESGMTSSKALVIFLLLILLAHFIIAAVAPDLLPGN